MDTITEKWYGKFLKGEVDFKDAIEGAVSEKGTEGAVSGKWSIGQKCYYLDICELYVCIRYCRIVGIKSEGEKTKYQLYNGFGEYKAEESDLFEDIHSAIARIEDLQQQIEANVNKCLNHDLRKM